MGNLVVQQFVSADGFAANDQNEFDLFDSMEGDSAEFDRSNLEWLEQVGAIVLGAVVESGDASVTVQRLKDEIPGDLILWGSLSLTHSLLRAGAVDSVRLVVLPLAIGSGRGVLPPGSPAAHLRLTGSRTFADGLVAVDYDVEPAPRSAQLPGVCTAVRRVLNAATRCRVLGAGARTPRAQIVKERHVQIDKSQILDMLRNQGDTDKAAQADSALPDKVDTDDSEHQNLLQRFGIDPMALAKQFLGGRGIPGL